MKKIIATISVLFGIIILVGCGKQPTIQTQNTLQVPTTQSTTQTSLVDETIGWEKYSDTQHGFEFKYLKNDNSLVVSDGSSEGLIFSVQKDGVEVFYGKFQNQSTMSTSECPKNLTKIGTIIIDGISANKCIDEKDTAGPAWNAMLQKKTSTGVDVYTVSCSKEHSNFEAYCEKILSTFEFTK